MTLETNGRQQNSLKQRELFVIFYGDLYYVWSTILVSITHTHMHTHARARWIVKYPAHTLFDCVFVSSCMMWSYGYDPTALIDEFWRAWCLCLCICVQCNSSRGSSEILRSLFRAPVRRLLWNGTETALRVLRNGQWRARAAWLLLLGHMIPVNWLG